MPVLAMPTRFRRAARCSVHAVPMLIVLAVCPGHAQAGGAPRVVAPVTPLEAAGHRAGAAINVSAMTYYSTHFPLIDQFKRAGGWYTQCTPENNAAGCGGFADGASGWDTREQARLDIDKSGWVRRLPAADDGTVKYRTVTALLFSGDKMSHPPGEYIVTYDGQGRISYKGTAHKVLEKSVPGRDVVSIDASDAGARIEIEQTNPSDYIRNIRVLPPGGICSADRTTYATAAADCTGKGNYVPFEKVARRSLWHPAYLQDLAGFRTIRFMDWANTNGTTLSGWGDRPRLNDAFWTGRYGVPLEAQLDLAKSTGATPWINIPPYASDEYVTKLGRKLKKKLGDSGRVFVEYGNEPWNYGFSWASWIKQQATDTWPEEIARGTSPYTLAHSWYGMRSSQLCSLIRAQFGAGADRVQCVLNAQAVSVWGAQQVMDCPYAKATLGKACSDGMYALAIGPYFGYYIGDLRWRDQVQHWYAQPDGGLGKLFEEILGQDAEGRPVTAPLYGHASNASPEGALAKVDADNRAQQAAAQARGLRLVAYEGGQHLIAPAGDTDPQWRDLIARAQSDARMATAYQRYMEQWIAVGGQDFNFYNHAGPISQYGAWGLKLSQFSAGDVKWQAVLPYKAQRPCWWAGCDR